jgi:shikimate dehydrogenase
MTLLFAIVGDPVAQVRSPEVFNRLFDERGVDAVMVPLLVRPSGFAASLSGLRKIENLAGLIVTVPHKASAAQLLNKASSRVKIANASNVLRPCLDGWEGDLFDGEGFARGMEAEGHVLEGAHCALVGCGGAGAAIALALLERDVASLSIWDIDQARAADLAQRLRAVTSVEISVAPPDAQSDVAINATPLGMDENDPVPFSLERLRNGALVADAVMKPPRTKLLREAERRGHPIQEGGHMLDNQVKGIWSFFGLP